MSLSNEQLVDVLKAAITTSSTEGIAAAQDADSFIDLSREQTAILQELRVETGIKTSFNLDSLALAEPVMVGATEAAAPAAADVVEPDRKRAVLQPVEVISAYDVSFSFLRKNIEGEDVNDTLNRIFAKRFGKDVVLAAFMGDTSIVGTTRTDKAKKVIDGYVTQAEADANVQDYVIPASPSYNTQVFPGMLSALPKDYRDEREMLGFFVSADVYDAYAQEIGNRATALGDMLLAGPWERNLSYMGIKLYPVFGLDTGRILLTPRENLALGFGREMYVGRDIDNRQRVLKVTITADIDAKYAVSDAVVLGATA
jgi:hypothetical protein